MKTQLIYLRYSDVGLQQSQYGGTLFTAHRVVRDVQAIQGDAPDKQAERGTIQFNHRAVPVYRDVTGGRPGSWTTNRADVLEPPRIFYVHGSNPTQR